MKLVRRLLAIMTGLALALTLWAYVATPTLFSASNAELTAKSTGTYNAIALEVPALLSQVVPLSPPEQSVLAGYIDPGLVESWAKQVLPALERYYRTGGAKPQLELTALSTRLTAAGVPVPPVIESNLKQPLTVSAGRLDPTLSQIVRWSEHLRLWGPGSAVILIILGMLFSRDKKYKWLAESFIWAAIVSLVIWLLLRSAPQLVAATIASSPAVALSMALKTWIEAIVILPMRQILYGAAGFGIAAITSLIIGLIASAIHRRAKHRA